MLLTLHEWQFSKMMPVHNLISDSGRVCMFVCRLLGVPEVAGAQGNTSGGSQGIQLLCQHNVRLGNVPEPSYALCTYQEVASVGVL